MEYCLLILFTATFSVYFVDFTLMPEKVKRWAFYKRYSKRTPYSPFSIKPFDCSGCLSVWLTWIFGGIFITTLWVIPVGFVAGCLSLLIKKQCL